VVELTRSNFTHHRAVSRDAPFTFGSGPSLLSGLSSKSTNPLRQVLDAIGTANEIEWKTYDDWMVWDYSDGKSFRLTTGNNANLRRPLKERQA